MNDTEFEVQKMLNHQEQAIQALLRGNNAQLEMILKQHQSRMAALMMCEVPALQDAVLGQLSDWLKEIIATEGGCADADDAREILHALHRIWDKLKTTGRMP